MSDDIIRRNVGSQKKLKIKPWMLWTSGAAVLGVYVFVIRPRAMSGAASEGISPSGDEYAYTDNGYGEYSPISGGASGVTPSSYAYYDPSTGQYVTQTGVTTSTVTTPTSNPQWVQMATAYLSNEGYDSVTVLAALGKYISGQGGQLSANQVSIVQAALAAIGPAPSAVPPPHVAPPVGQKPPTKPKPPAKSGLRVIHGKVQTKGTFYEIAARHHMTVPQFATLNPALAVKYLNTGKMIPAGTLIKWYAKS